MQPPKLSSDAALFLDFDGTLTELAPTPDAVRVAKSLPPTLESLRGYLDGAMAIVSGRGLGDVFGFLSPFSGPGAGSHGLEMRLASGELLEPERGVADAANTIAERLKPLLGAHPRLIVENKSWSCALHYRAEPHLEAECLMAMQAALEAHGDWEVVRGKMVVEARPKGVSKATAVEKFMQTPPFAGRTPIFVGDDRTDEDGMRAAGELGGYGIKVGEGESVARYRLPDVDAVHAYLASFADRDA